MPHNCKLCLDDLPPTDIFTIKDCKCMFCHNCMVQYVRVIIEDGSVLALNCPSDACQQMGQLSEQEIKQLSGRELFARYLRLNYEREIDRDPKRCFCPAPGCDTVCFLGRNILTSPRPCLVQCSTCQFRFCSDCRSLWHPQRSCDEVLCADHAIPFTCQKNASIKRCPVCRIPIERNNGCAQMMCTRCRAIFCWFCLTRLDDDFFLRHYDTGPCKNKLGHTRASVLMHRVQVIGVFIGFSMLLVAASPFLLLAAPCILSCKFSELLKCSSGQMAEQDDDVMSASAVDAHGEVPLEMTTPSSFESSAAKTEKKLNNRVRQKNFFTRRRYKRDASS